MPWVLLVVAGIFEIGWAVGLKYTAGFSRFWPTAATIVAMLVSIGLLGIAVRTLPIGTAYAIWTGIGTVGTVVVGILLLDEPVTIIRVTCMLLIVMGIVGLKLATPH